MACDVLSPARPGLVTIFEIMRGSLREAHAGLIVLCAPAGTCWRQAVANRCLSSSVAPHAMMIASMLSNRPGSSSPWRILQMVDATGRPPHRFAISRNDGFPAQTLNCRTASMYSAGVLAVLGSGRRSSPLASLTRSRRGTVRFR